MKINFVKRRKIFYAVSAVLLLASIFGLIAFKLKPGMDFTGGSLMEISGKNLNSENIKSAFMGAGLAEPVISPFGNDSFLIRAKELTDDQHSRILADLKKVAPEAEQSRFENIGPSIGAELKKKSINGIIFVVLGIALYLTWAFRKVSHPMPSWKYGTVTILALAHDVLIPSGLFAFLGHFLGVEIDSSFVVALLVVLGFSVHDTIVVLDRIRENLKTSGIADFSETVNRSINETFVRSINTSLTLILVLTALLIFGPVSLKNFTLTLLVGTFFGTYSSIFIASPALLDWHLLGGKKNNSGKKK